MASSKDPRIATQQNRMVEVLPPLPDWHAANDPLASFERILRERDERVALLELHQQETDHRVKNSLQLVASLVRAQTEAHREVDAKRLAAEVSERIGLIARIHDLLCRQRTETVDLGDLLIELCRDTSRLLESNTSPIIEVDTVGCKLAPQRAAAIALIVHELLLNSFKHAAATAGRTHVTVQLRRSSERGIRVAVEDDGGGSPTIEGATAGVGLMLVRKISRSVGATVNGQATGRGCRFTIDLPVAENREHRRPGGTDWTSAVVQAPDEGA